MKLVLVRHGEPDYSIVLASGHIGMGVELAQLTERGISQAEAASKDERLKGAEVIISSPYTRALQTAAIISKNTGLNIIIENGLHEWCPNLPCKRKNIPFRQIFTEMKERNGKWDSTCKTRWEEFDEVGERAFNALRKYIGKYEIKNRHFHCPKSGLLQNQSVFHQNFRATFDHLKRRII